MLGVEAIWISVHPPYIIVSSRHPQMSWSVRGLGDTIAAICDLELLSTNNRIVESNEGLRIGRLSCDTRKKKHILVCMYI